MKLVLPPGLSRGQFDRALRSFARVVGDAHVFNTDQDRESYIDPYAPGDPLATAASAGVAPATTEEVQAIVRIANEFKVPLWPISRGKNYGYGGPAPSLAGSVILDLNRMKRIIEVNEDYGYVLLEPGVGFNDLYDHLQKAGSKLWMSAPAQTWGSVVGNALDRGVGYTPYGEHASKVCGMEVVLPNGELVRTGMGALPNSNSWQLFKYGFGPSWDGMFMQSPLGVVTKMGLWLMPAPEATTSLSMSMPNEADLALAVDVIRPFKLDGTIQANPSIGNVIRNLASRNQRSDFYQGKGAMPESVLEEARKRVGVGYWNFSIRLFGQPEINAINARRIKEAFARVTPTPFREETWTKGQPMQGSGSPTPSFNALSIVNWMGGRGGHLTFSPISEPSGAEAMKQYKATRALFEKFGFDYYGGFTAGERYLNHITMIVYDRDDAEMTGRARTLFTTLVDEAAKNGWGEYRSHVAFSDRVANAYSFNNNAMLRLNEQVKDALDPNGVIAPGRQGIWPKAYRRGRK